MMGVHSKGNAIEMKLGLIAGNGRFPFLLLDAARAEGLEVVVAAIKEETDPEINRRAEADSSITVHWLSLGELSRLIETFKNAGVAKAVMAGQVKHKQIFSSIRPDWRLAKLLLNLRTRSTDALLGAIAKVLSDEGIELISSTTFLEPLLAQEGVLTSRAPDADECLNIEYGLGVAQSLAAFDIGQTVVVAAQACVAVEAMEGTDATIDRAGLLMRSLNESTALAEPTPGDAAAEPFNSEPPPHRRQSRQAQSGHALRRARHRPINHRNHDPCRSHMPLHRGRPHPALRPRSPAQARQ